MVMADGVSHTEAVQFPHNIDAERALLGAVLLDNAQIDIVNTQLPAEAVSHALQSVEEQPSRRPRRGGEPPLEPLFFSRQNQLIFGAVNLLHQTGEGVDLTTLSEFLARRQLLETAGGPIYLAGLEDDIYSLNQVPQYARIVADKWKLRCLIRAAQSITQEAMQASDDPSQLIDRSEKRIFEISQEQRQQDFKHVSDVVPDLIHELEERNKGNAEQPGVRTHFRELDQRCAGFRPAQLIILAARPSMGKTAFALNIAKNIVLKENRPVAVFSLEMSAEELTQRIMCTLAHVPMGRVRRNKPLRPHEQSAMQEAADRLMDAPLYIDDASSLNILELRARSRRLKSRNPQLGMIIVDYLQLMHGSSRHSQESRQQEVSEISRSLKSLARELEIPIIALSQLSRQSEQRKGAKDKLPKLSDLRESGAIEQDADIVIFIHRERDMEAPQTDDPEPEIATIRIGKQRNGTVGDFNMLFRGQYTEFGDLAPGASV